uniref:Putative capsid protein n=1 Tax=Motacilla cinerea CRESS-DNA-virus sp. TaxID=2815043 RepID=A0A8A4XC70_9VIRU|nr:MAG: putative capsid protein [Motacilla cinerea CRESS-DNA-virus sp.]
MGKVPSRRPVRYTPYGGRARQIARTLIAQAGKAALRYGVSKLNSSSAPKAAVATTTQHDVARQYRYKRMPRAKRRRWVKALKKNSAMDMAESSTQTLVLNSTVTGTVDFLANGKTQNWLAVHLYGINGSPAGGANEVGVEDIRYLKQNDSRLVNQQNTHVKFESGILDLTVKNPNESNGLEVDIYEVCYRSTTRQASLTTMHTNIFNTTVGNRAVPTPNDVAAWDRRGITPFDTVQFGAFGGKILSKKKVFLPPGNTFTYQYRDPKNHYFGPDVFDDHTGFIEPKATRTILFIYKTITGEAISGSNPACTIGVSRIYKYKIKGEVQSGIIVG